MRSLTAIAGILSLSVLAGCGGGTTYGTGTSHTTQTASAIGSLLLLDAGGKKQPINYASRPKLVKAPSPDALPSPVERITSDSAYFPTNPEEARAQRLAKQGELNDRDGAYAYGAQSALPEGATLPDSGKKSTKFHNGDSEESAAEMLRTSVQGREARLKRAQEARQIAGGAAPRKYLTQPPSEYRKPAESAPVGIVGEYEKSEAEKKKKPIFGSWGS